jgi:DNA-binding transcriptional ArsR family regulator
MRWATLDGNDHALYLTDQLFNQMVQLAMTTDRLSSTFAALADPTRRAILARLALGETSVSKLAEPFEMSMPAVSKHLKVLERAGLITRSRDAQMRPCRIEATALKEADDWLEEYRRLWEQRLDRLDDYLRVLQSKEKKRGRKKQHRP